MLNRFLLENRYGGNIAKEDGCASIEFSNHTKMHGLIILSIDSGINLEVGKQLAIRNAAQL